MNAETYARPERSYDNATIIGDMKSAALQAASAALAEREKGLTIETKPDGSKVTSGDKAAQAAIETVLSPAARAINARMLGEENPDVDNDLLAWRRANKKGSAFIYDPVDGTSNFIAGKQWAVLVAHEQDGDPTMAVTFIPAPDATSTHLKGMLYESDVLRAHAIEIDERRRPDGKFDIVPTRFIDLTGKLMDMTHAGESLTGTYFPKPGEPADFKGKYSTKAMETVTGTPGVTPNITCAGADMMKVLSGATYNHGHHGPWDMAPKLILKTAGVSVIEREAVNPSLSSFVAGPKGYVIAADQRLRQHYGNTAGKLVFASTDLQQYLYPGPSPRV